MILNRFSRQSANIPVALKSYLIVNHIYGSRLATATLPSSRKTILNRFSRQSANRPVALKSYLIVNHIYGFAACDSYATLPLEKRYSIVFLGRVPTGRGVKILFNYQSYLRVGLRQLRYASSRKTILNRFSRQSANSPVALKSYLIVNHIYGLRLATATLPSSRKMILNRFSRQSANRPMPFEYGILLFLNYHQNI